MMIENPALQARGNFVVRIVIIQDRPFVNLINSFRYAVTCLRL